MTPIPLSVLDVVPVRHGSTAAIALRETLELARAVEAMGYRRYWFAEHHGMGGIASSAPALLVGQVAAATTTLRVGSGGVMLPNHASLVVAEQFGTLEALYPGRIDLGLGRAPGSDPLTAAVLRRELPQGPDDFPEQLAELFAFFRGTFPVGHPYARLNAVPARGNEPPVWLLGSSDYSAQLAGKLGLPFAFAHHFSQENTLPALRRYREAFRPSATLAQPYAMVAASVTVADTDDEALRLALPSALAFLKLRQGKPGLYPTLEQAQAHAWAPGEQDFVEGYFAKNIVGSASTVRAQLGRLLEDTRADELMVLCAVPDPIARTRSYALLRELHGTAQPMVGAYGLHAGAPPATAARA
jgi:luciferase family oxidoreductase group 1